ncbi:MAG: helix-turn-helix transcriptional regulator [Firmicutes bacterium]|nr:helix-turn-helix transcriptional regulator [Bacillota bacterium]
MQPLSTKIYVLRKQFKLTQGELAAKIGVTTKMISFYERGERLPSRESLIKLASVFGVSLDSLVNEAAKDSLNEKMALLQEKDGLYFRFASRAKELDLSEKDMDFILDIYKRYKA